MTYSNTKRFFSETRAKAFAAQVNGDLWESLDCFGQNIYEVKWN